MVTQEESVTVSEVGGGGIVRGEGRSQRAGYRDGGEWVRKVSAACKCEAVLALVIGA